MKTQMTGNIAIGVGAGNLHKAADFYEDVLGLKRGKSSEKWIEILAGPLNFYLVDDEHDTPTFEILVEDVNQAMDRYLASGCEESMLGESAKERYIRTPFGQFICVSPFGEN